MGNRTSQSTVYQGPGRPPSKPYRKAEKTALHNIFNGLALHSQSGKTIDKETFLKFFSNLPGMLGERTFTVFNRSRSGEIDFEEFHSGLACYCRGSLEQKIAFIFRMFDLNNDSLISRSELETMLNSFVFAAEAIVSGKEAEPSVMRREESLNNGNGNVGYRALNVLGIDESLTSPSSSPPPARQIFPTSSMSPSAQFDPFASMQPVAVGQRRQSLPRPQSLYHSQSQSHWQPTQFTAPSTPPPHQQQSHGAILPPQSHFAATPVSTSLTSQSSSAALALTSPSYHSAAGHGLPHSQSFDFTLTVSSERIQHMVEVAMKIAAKDQGRASSQSTSAMVNDGGVVPTLTATSSTSALHGVSTPVNKRASPAYATPHTHPAAHPHAHTHAHSNSDDGNDNEPQLSMYAFATWIQEFPEVIWVLDASFPPNQDLIGSDGSSKDDATSSPIHDRDLSAPLDRLNNDSHLFSSLMSQLSGSKNKIRRGGDIHAAQLSVAGHHHHSHSHHSSHPHTASHPSNPLHGRAFSVTSLLSPQIPIVNDSHHHHASIGTDVIDAQHRRPRNDGIEVRCQQCGWEVLLKHCYQCGKRIHIQQKLSQSQPQSSSSIQSQSQTQSLSLSCSKCGILFLNGHLHYCVQCGFDFQRTGQKIEPPLVKSLSWQRKAGRSHIMEGTLLKVGKTFKSLVSRHYVLRDNFLYTYRTPGDLKPSHVLFLEGCFVEPVNHEDKNSKLKYGFEIILNEDNHITRCLYAGNQSQRQAWMEALRYHSNVHSIEDYYDIGPELGVGKFSSVHLGTSKTSGKQYAIKIIDKSDIAEKEKEALRTEVAVLKLLHHPHIIRCKNVFETRKQMFIVMTLVRGGDLFERLTKRRRYSETTARKLMYDLLSVVQYLHLRGIVHHDLKPENIMLTRTDDDSEIMIADFGLSRFTSEASQTRIAAGTLNYAAPEVLRPDTTYGREVDLWACGVILYLLVSGTLPFDSKHREEIINQTIAGKASFDNPIWKAISEECKSLIRGLLQVDPSKRLTCVQALNHAWIAKSSGGGDSGGSGEKAFSNNSAPSSPMMTGVGVGGGVPMLQTTARNASDTLPTLTVPGNNLANNQPESPASSNTNTYTMDDDDDSEDEDESKGHEDDSESVEASGSDLPAHYQRQERFMNFEASSDDEEQARPPPPPPPPRVNQQTLAPKATHRQKTRSSGQYNTR